MALSYFEYLYSINKKQETPAAPEKTVQDEVADAAIVQDEAIGKPWTHKYTIYCANPSKDFQENLKKNECIVAVYEKVKETAETPSDKEEIPPPNK